jgi:D-amino-acid dehydrogenase
MNRDVIGGVFYPEAATLNPYRFVVELAERAKRHGATFQTGADAEEILMIDGQARGVRLKTGKSLDADAVVLAAGAYGASLMRELGLRFPLQAAKGYHTDRESSEGKPPLLRHAYVLGENMVFCTPMDGFVRFAGTLEFSGVNHNIRRPRLEQLTNASKRYLNGADQAASRSEWCGLRPCMPDGLPAIGPVSRYPGLFIATGHAMLGLTLGPITGKLISECLLDGSSSIALAGLSPERFERRPAA